jgi:hypothetical protein
VLESLFEFLFKFRPQVFAEGAFRFSPSAAVFVAGLAAVAGLTATLVTYRNVRRRTRADRIILIGLRTALVVTVLFCLMRPVLILKAAVPQQNFLAVVLDDSRSMRVADRDGKPRSEFVDSQFAGPESSVLSALSQRFLLRFFRFSSSAERLPENERLTFAGTETHVGEALQRVREEVSGLPLAGIVLVTDGADTSQASVSDALLALRADRIPVYTVGVGRDTISRDIQVSRASTPRSVLKGTSLVVDVIVTQAGYRGTTVPLNVETDGRIVATEDVTLPSDGQPATVRVRFTAAEAGPRVFRFRIPPQTGEMVTQNNARDVLIEVEDRREKILYFEGEPRFEAKFLRRAVNDDKNLQLVVLQRTAENKYLRLEVDNADELVGGFPKTREELFKGLILGSIEAGAFTGDQLRMIAEFVDRRGGGLLMLGGRRAFGEGGYAGTPVADILPVALDSSAASASAYLARLAVRPTRVGATHGVTQIAASEAESDRRWKDLPEVTSVNVIRDAKPGATILLNGADENHREQPVLAYEHYGRGRTIAFPVQDSWLWQLHAKIPVDDMTHENFWRQLLRWLTDGSHGPVLSETSAERVEKGESATVDADVADPAFVGVNNARVSAEVTSPSGRSQQVAMQWTGQRDGEYRGTFAADEDGVYRANVSAVRAGVDLGSDDTYVRAAPSDNEYFDPAMRAQLLKRIADETGGRFYESSGVAALAEDVKYSGRGVTTIEERELWDMPALLILMLGLLITEWTYRRVRELA